MADKKRKEHPCSGRCKNCKSKQAKQTQTEQPAGTIPVLQTN